MRKWKICIPTYGRKLPKSLSMLSSDHKLHLYYFVRSEDYDKGFYDELKIIDRVHVVPLEYGLHELGETRDRIMKWCERNRVKYCCMFDDGIVNVVIDNKHKKITKVIDYCIKLMEEDIYRNKMIGFSMHKRIGYYADGTTCMWNDSHVKDENYFLTMPAQALIINVDIAKNHNIRYKSLDEVGFEDCAFFADAVKAGLIFGARKSIRIDGVVPNEKKLGGSHKETEDIEKKYDMQNSRCLKYIGNLMGVYLEKRYRSFAKGLMSYIVFDTDFYREVLCVAPKENKKIIEQHLCFNKEENK